VSLALQVALDTLQRAEAAKWWPLINEFGIEAVTIMRQPTRLQVRCLQPRDRLNVGIGSDGDNKRCQRRRQAFAGKRPWYPRRHEHTTTIRGRATSLLQHARHAVARGVVIYAIMRLSAHGEFGRDGVAVD
jgi:hypothetical protein